MTKAQRHEVSRFSRQMWELLRYAASAPAALVCRGPLRTARLLERRGFLLLTTTARGFSRAQLTDAGHEALNQAE
jgi:hypothetical protein